MSTRPVDLLVVERGRPVAVVEAKGIPVPPAFRGAVLEQLRLYARRTSSRWALLVDPVSMAIYSSEGIGEPVAEVPAPELLRSAGIDAAKTVGGRTLLLAVERWLSAVPRSPELAERYPELAEFFADVRRSDQVLVDAQV